MTTHTPVLPRTAPSTSSPAVTAHTRAWIDEEVQEWMRGRVAVRDQELEAVDPVIAATAGRRFLIPPRVRSPRRAHDQQAVA